MPESQKESLEKILIDEIDISLKRGVSDGGYSSGETPVPIPNTEVKTAYADGTARATVWKSRSPPSLTPLKF